MVKGAILVRQRSGAMVARPTTVHAGRAAVAENWNKSLSAARWKIWRRKTCATANCRQLERKGPAMECDVCNDSGAYWNSLLQQMRPCVNGCKVPAGVWHCPTCHFQLEQCTLDPNTLAVTTRDEPGAMCQNCKTALERGQPVN